MKKTKYVWLSLFVCVSLALVACEKNEENTAIEKNKKDENKAEIVLNESKSTIDEEGNVVTEETTEEPIQVAVIGSKWKDEAEATFVSADWKKGVPNGVRFVLISNEETISQEKQKILQTWIKEDIVVLFYGENVQPEEVKEKIGMEIGTIEVRTDASFDFPYLLYGYGFSTTYEQYLPIFLGSNTYADFEGKIATFLLKNKNF